MILATISTQGAVNVATALPSLDSALDWLIVQSGRFGRVGSLLTIETLDGFLVHSVVIPWQAD